MSIVAVIDYGMGNLHSVAKAVEHAGGGGTRVLVTAERREIDMADRVVFPGVGAMRDCMAEIRRLGFDDLVPRLVEEKPVLAICVGMQALMEHSEENQGVDCIGLFQGRVRRFPHHMLDDHGAPLKVPHMGWNVVRQRRRGAGRVHPLWRGIPDQARFYFVHSYYVDPVDRACVEGESDYPEPFTAAIARANLFGVQFHPEKSQDHGLQLLKNFLAWDGGC